MCFPAAAVAGAGAAAAPAAAPLAAAGGLLALYQQGQNYKAEKKYQAATFDATKKAADADALNQYAAIETRSIQETEKASQAIQKVATEAVVARGSARAAAAEGGVSGNSVQNLLDDFTRQETEYQSQVIRNRAFLESQFGSEMIGIRARQEAEIRSGVGQPIQPPQYLNGLIQTASKVLAISYNTEHNLNPNG